MWSWLDLESHLSDVSRGVSGLVIHVLGREVARKGLGLGRWSADAEVSQLVWNAISSTYTITNTIT